MKEKILTDNTTEKILVRWDGERFGIIHQYRNPDGTATTTAIILNPKEMLDLIDFAGKQGGK